MKKIIFSLILFPAISFAQPEPHNCNQPEIPNNLENEKTSLSFNNSVREYEECITKYVENSKKLAEAYNSQGKSAAEEWNNFVDSINENLPEKE